MAATSQILPPRQEKPLAWWLAALGASAAYAAAAVLVRLAGFDSVSDDDHARVVLAQGFAHAPRLDPTGSSWLPAPFWLHGAALRVLGSGLAVARGLAVVQAAASGALLVAAASCAGQAAAPSASSASSASSAGGPWWAPAGPAGAALGALLGLTIPLVAVLGAAPVPELPVAAAVAFALLHLGGGPRAPRWRWGLASAVLLLATLSRYEAWGPALMFAGCAAWWSRRRPGLLACAAAAAAGPLLWILWNLHTHGHPLAFARRVAAYRAGLGAVAAGLGAYPEALLREGAVAVVAGVLAAWRWPRLRLPVLGATLAVLALSVAEARGGAPTHHPERAVLGPLLVLLLAGWSLVASGQGRASAARPVSAAGLVALLVGLVGQGAMRLGPTWRGLGASRGAEVALGRALAVALPPGEKALLVADSYGYLAIEAALDRPGALVVVTPRSVDPRSSVEVDPRLDEGSLRGLRERAGGAAWLLLRGGQAAWMAPVPGEIALPGGRLVRWSAGPGPGL